MLESSWPEADELSSGTVGGSLLCESSPAGQTDSVHVSQGKLCIYNFHHFLAPALKSLDSVTLQRLIVVVIVMLKTYSYSYFSFGDVFRCIPRLVG